MDLPADAPLGLADHVPLPPAASQVSPVAAQVSQVEVQVSPAEALDSLLVVSPRVSLVGFVLREIRYRSNTVFQRDLLVSGPLEGPRVDPLADLLDDLPVFPLVSHVSELELVYGPSSNQKKLAPPVFPPVSLVSEQ